MFNLIKLTNLISSIFNYKSEFFLYARKFVIFIRHFKICFFTLYIEDFVVYLFFLFLVIEQNTMKNYWFKFHLKWLLHSTDMDLKVKSLFFWQQISNDDDDEIDKKFAFVDMKICCFLFFNQKNWFWISLVMIRILAWFFFVS